MGELWCRWHNRPGAHDRFLRTMYEHESVTQIAHQVIGTNWGDFMMIWCRISGYLSATIHWSSSRFQVQVENFVEELKQRKRLGMAHISKLILIWQMNVVCRREIQV